MIEFQLKSRYFSNLKRINKSFLDLEIWNKEFYYYKYFRQLRTEKYIKVPIIIINSKIIIGVNEVVSRICKTYKSMGLF